MDVEELVDELVEELVEELVDELVLDVMSPEVEVLVDEEVVLDWF